MRGIRKSIFFIIIFLVICPLASCGAEVNVAQPLTPAARIMREPAEPAHAAAPATNPDVDVTENHRDMTEEESAAEPTESAPVTEEPAPEPVVTAPVIAEPAAVTEQPPAAGPRNIPIFMYHTSSEYNPGGLAELYVRPSEFKRQIRHLSENGYTFVTFDDWFDLHNIEKPVFITFDDGYKANFTEIFPILQMYNARITIFLTLDNIERENFTVEMIREMSDSGLVKFESHTISHVDLVSISADDERLRRELRDSRAMIEDITGRPVLAIAYPAGRSNARVIERAREYYMFGVRADGGMHSTNFGDFEIRRFRVNRSTTLNDFINMLGQQPRR